LAAAGSGTAASALAVIMFPVEALGAFNISIFGLHGRRPGRCPVAPIPPPSPPAACVCSGKQALSNIWQGCHQQKGGVPRSSHQKHASEVQSCILPVSFLPIYSTEEYRSRSGHRTLPNTNRYQLQSLVYLCLDPQPAIHRPPGSTCQ
jgi:hypothetical protein